MKTHSEWISYFRGIGMDWGDIWHLIDGLYAMGFVIPLNITAAESRGA